MLDYKADHLGNIKGIIRYRGNDPSFCLKNTRKTVLEIQQASNHS